MKRARIRFTQTAPFGKLAKIEGAVHCAENALEFELALTESISGPVGGVLKRAVAYRDLEEVRFRRRFFRKSLLVFHARTLTAFESIPGAKGYRYAVNPTSGGREARAFATEAGLAIAHAAMDEFVREIEDATSSDGGSG